MIFSLLKQGNEGPEQLLYWGGSPMWPRRGQSLAVGAGAAKDLPSAGVPSPNLRHHRNTDFCLCVLRPGPVCTADAPGGLAGSSRWEVFLGWPLWRNLLGNLFPFSLLTSVKDFRTRRGTWNKAHPRAPSHFNQWECLLPWTFRFFYWQFSFKLWKSYALM